MMQLISKLAIVALAAASGQTCYCPYNKALSWDRFLCLWEPTIA